MSVEDPIKNKTEKTVEAAEAKSESDPSDKRDFLEVVEMFEKRRDQLGYHEMVNDIVAMLNDWDNEYSQSLREHYPGWRREDFKELLDQLGEEFEDLGDREKIEDLEKKISELDWATRGLFRGTNYEGFNPGLEGRRKEIQDIVPERLAKSEEERQAIETQLQSFGWFKRNFSGAAKSKIFELQGTLGRLNRTIKEHKEYLEKWTPIIAEEEKRAEDAKKRSEEETERVQNSTRCVELTEEKAALVKELKKIRGF